MKTEIDKASENFKKSNFGNGFSSEESIERMTRDIGEKVGTLTSDASHTAQQYYKTSRDYVKENPVKGVLVATAVGAIAGGLFAMSTRSKRV